mmetsp:Transcript_105209/g.234796  ORF Transcript_105209/g.234796 Transcript_105209/m.234796 type:complete len:461 (+) Transcript_105209:89-1471(+)
MSRILITVVAMGALTLCAGANPHASLGGYTPVSNVVEHAQIVHDICDLNTAANSLDFVTAKAIYTNGRYSCKSSSARTLQGFVSASTVTSKLTGQAFFDSFTNGAGPSSPQGPIPGSGRLTLATSFWDDFMIGAFDGAGDFAGKSDTMRKVAVKKGALGVLTMYVARELESAISKAASGSTADSNGAPHAWDEGWAFLYGSHTSTAGKCSAWEFARKRDLDYAYDSSNNAVSGATHAKTDLLAHFLEGQNASRTSTLSVAQLVTSRDNIYRLLALSSIRAGLKYSLKMQNPYNEEYHMECYAYFLAAAGWIQQAAGSSGTNAQDVLALVDFKLAEGALNADVYCAVKAKLIPIYSALGLDCTMVGTYKSIGSKTCSGLPSCPTGVSALPTGLSSFLVTDPGVTTAGANVDCGTVHPDYPAPAPAPAPLPPPGSSSASQVGAMAKVVVALIAYIAMHLGST